MASGIPFGLGAFIVFVRLPFFLVKTRDFLLTLPSKLSSIMYLVQSYGAGAAASGKFLSVCLKHIVWDSL